MTRRVWWIVLFMTLATWRPLVVQAEEVRIKDLVNFKGYRGNQLLGFGLVVGLPGSGDSAKSLTTNRALAQMVTNLGLVTKPEAITSQSVAAVLVTGELPPFAKNGDRVTIKVSVVGDAKSLAGGTLVSTQLKAANDMVYAVAQGPIVTGRITGGGAPLLTSATIPDGAVVEREFVPEIVRDGAIDISLKTPDFTNNARVVEKINAHLRGFFAESMDPSHIRVRLPPNFAGRAVDFIAEIEALKIDADKKAVVVVNERTGTVVMGSEVVIDKVVISHGDLSIVVGKGKDAKAEHVVGVEGATVGQLVMSLNAIGVKPADLVSILQSIHASGALRGELKVL